MPFVRAADLTVAYELRGDPAAPVLVLMNSLGTSLHVWDDVADALAAEYRVLRYDMRGHGLTAGLDSPAGSAEGVDALAADLRALLDALGIAQVRAAGLSLGGMVAQRFAAAFPARCAGIVLLGTGNRIGERAGWDERIAAVERDGVAGVVDAVLARWFTPRTHAERPELIAGYATMLRRTPVEGYLLGCRAVRDADLRADDAAIRCPALILSGEGDAVTPPASGEAMRAAIAGARMRVVEGAAHIIPAERPRTVTGAMLPFLREIDRALEVSR